MRHVKPTRTLPVTKILTVRNCRDTERIAWGPFNAEGHVGMMIFARSPIGLLQALKGAKRDVSFLGKRKDFSEGRWPHGSGAI